MEQFTVTQINEEINPTNYLFVPIEGNNAAWYNFSDSNDLEIFLYNGNETIQITDNDVSDFAPIVDDNGVVWQSLVDDRDTELFFYNGSETIQITDNDVSDFAPQISGNNIVWQSILDDSNFSEIFFYNGSETIQITDNDVSDSAPQISANNIVWQSSVDGNDGEIFFYNGSETIQLTDNDVNDSSPLIDGNNIVWQNGTGGSSEIFLYDGSETIQITDNDVLDSPVSNTPTTLSANTASISGNNVVWQSGIGDSREIFLYDGNETIKLTDNDVPDLSPQINGDNVVWQSGIGNDSEIFFYNGSETIQLTDDNVENAFPAISDSSILWQEWSVSEENRIKRFFVATFETDDDNSTLGTTVYRFFNNSTGVHFYTANETERDAVLELDNFSFEGGSYRAVDLLTGMPEPLPVYRFFNQDTGVHLYTISEAERDATQQLSNFSFEGEAFYAYETEEVEGSIPIYRFFNSNTGAHFYTPSEAEKDNVEANLPEFQSEGIAYYALPISEVI